ncbi:CaiB/BaiF CoA transferase family protein [Nocardioides jishulii]|uniref:CoA transferase n=1 Tax=Nocardioides jishulii TaxID=2575440 RepID=A0A4U2YKL9_9ACTN|nr:CoA transferase [Nocardioides jishulii]QCX26820.1 CoA transferase [Nocardioides jishulii]TKI61304.1 CoA transferase [Nocardioides jishulii]
MSDASPHSGHQPASPAPSSLPLSGIRVLELGNFIAAPTATRMLADFGAEVIKVERPRTGDELRNWRLFAGETSMLYRTLNRNKLSVELDLRSEAGLRAAKELITTCDVLVENFRPGTLDRWGLDAATLEELNPELVVARISAFGQTGPMAARPGFAAVAEAYGGLRELVGEADRPPSRVGVSIGDSIAGLYAAFGIVMQLHQRERARGAGGTGPSPAQQHVDVALHEAIFSMMESLVPDVSAYGVTRVRTGGRMEGIAPSNAYPCADGDVVISGNADNLFPRFMRAIGRDDLAEDPALVNNKGRWDRRDELDDAIGAWTKGRTREEALEVLEEAGVPAGPIMTASDIMVDEQFLARDMVQTLPVQVDGDVRDVAFPGVVPVLGERSISVRHVGPDLGEHNAYVLGELLGWSPEAVAEATGR